jgi:hypothetical protein
MSSGMIVMKPIKPNALKSAAMQKVLKDELQKTSKDILFDFEATAWNWKHKVKFQRLMSIGPNSVDIMVATDDEIYGYVDNGTKSHTIVPKKPGGVLTFRVGGSPKTEPGKMVSGSGSLGTEWRRTKKVTKNKVRPRNFSKKIQKEWDKGKYKNRMEKAMNEAVKQSGHQFK